MRPNYFSPGTILFLVFIGSVFILNIFWDTTDCEFANPILPDTKNWRISESDFPVNILWQKRDDRPIRTAFSFHGLTASSEHVVYYRERTGNDCDKTHLIITFDLQTGVEEWVLPPEDKRHGLLYSYTSGFNDVTSVKDGYVVIMNDSSVYFVDYKGNIQWINDRFPSRSIRRLYPMDDTLYIPSTGKVYQLTLETGDVIDEIELTKLVDFLWEYTLVYYVERDALHFRLIDFPNRNNLFDVGAEINLNFYPNSNNLIFKVADRTDEVLLIYNDVSYSTLVQVYDLQSGELLWVLEKPLKGLPYLTDEKLYVYNEDGLEAYALDTGQFLGRVVLTRITKNDVIGRVALAGYDDVIVINFLDTWELVTLQADDF